MSLIYNNTYTMGYQIVLSLTHLSSQIEQFTTPDVHHVWCIVLIPCIWSYYWLQLLSHKTLWKRHTPRWVLLHQDNRPVHISWAVMEAVDECDYKLLHHPSYSPDLAPRDLHVFPKLGKHLWSQRFEGWWWADSCYGGLVMRPRCWFLLIRFQWPAN